MAFHIANASLGSSSHAARLNSAAAAGAQEAVCTPSLSLRVSCQANTGVFHHQQQKQQQQRTAGRRRRAEGVVRHAKFQGFGGKGGEEGEGEGTENGAVATERREGEEEGAAAEEKRDDEVMPESLDGATQQAARAAALFCSTGGTRALVELLLPDLENLSEEGAQQRLWDCARSFLLQLRADMGYVSVRAVFPDAGSAALLKHQWGDADFSFSSLNDRQPVKEEDEVVVLVAPDYQLLDVVERIANSLASEDGLTRPLVLWNPRLSSGDVGVGLNVRRLREFFLGSFTAVYHLRPLGVGAVFRCYPGPWQTFLDDPNEPGRYILLKQQGRKPDADDIEEMYMATVSDEENAGEGPSAFDQVVSVMNSFSRFMNSLSK